MLWTAVLVSCTKSNDESKTKDILDLLRDPLRPAPQNRVSTHTQFSAVMKTVGPFTCEDLRVAEMECKSSEQSRCEGE